MKVFEYTLLRVRLHYQFSGMPGLPNFPEKMAYVIHTKYQYHGKSVNLRSHVVRILRFLIRLVIQIFITKSAIEYISDPDAESHAWSVIFNLSQYRRSSTFKKTLATSSGAHVLAHLLKSFVDTHPLAAKSINIVRI